MKTRTKAAGGALIGAAILGAWLMSLWKTPGMGGAEGIDPLQQQDRTARVDAQLTSSTTIRDAERTTPVTPSDLLTVVIHGDQFRLSEEDDPQSGLDVSLAEIKRKASDVPGNDRGIRVRILKEKSAQAGARADLYAALTDAGVKREEIQERSDFID